MSGSERGCRVIQIMDNRSPLYLMRVTVPRSLSLCESTHPVKGQAGRHRLLRAPGMSQFFSIPTEPSALRDT